MATLAPTPRSTTITLASASSGPFLVGFRLFDTDAVVVFADGVLREDAVLSATFVNGYTDTATISFPAALDAETILIIDSSLTPKRDADYINGDPNLTQKLNVELARMWGAIADVKRDAARGIKGFYSSIPFFPTEGAAIIWGPDGQPENGPDAAAILGAEAAADRAEAAADLATEAIAGVHLIYATREALASAVPTLTNGQMVFVRGVPAFIDSTATGTLSALNDLGVNGVRLAGDIIRSDWWLDGSTGDKSTLITAMNTYANARYGTAGKACAMEFTGTIQIANQITLGTTGTGVLKSFSIDAISAIFQVITGGGLAADPEQCAIIVQNCTRSYIRFSQIQCGHICGGMQVDRCPNSIFDGMNIDKFAWRGLWVRGNAGGGEESPGTSAGAIFNKITGNEWRNDEAEFAESANFVATGIYNESHDVRFIMAHIGWCYIPIHNLAGSCEFIACHPFNGNNGGIREHAYAFLNDGNSTVNIYDMYADNGYVIDRTGGLNISGLDMLDLNSVMAQPYVRVNSTPDLPAVKGQLDNVRTSVGYYAVKDVEDQGEPIVILAMGQSNMRSHTDMTVQPGNNVIQHGVYIWNGTPGTVGSAFIPAAYGTFPLDISGDLTYASNLAIAAANNLRISLGRPVYVILMAASAVEIERFITPATLTANGWSTGTNYTSTIFSQFAAALAAVPDHTKTVADYLLWHQGEANSADSATVYANKFLAMESDFRTQGIISNAGTVIVGGELRDGHAFGATLITAWGTITSTKSNAVLVDSSGIPYEGTTPHFTGAGIEEFGCRYAWAAMSQPTNIPYNSNNFAGDRFRVEATSKQTRYILGSGTPDEEWIKQGTSAVEIVQKFNPGAGNPVTMRYNNGRLTVYDHVTGLGDIRLQGGTRVGIHTEGLGSLHFYAGGAEAARFQVAGHLIPGTNGVQNLGQVGNRWNTLYATNGTISTSDREAKQDIRELSEAEGRVALRLKSMMRAYRLKDAVAEKGDDARIHVGIIAQEAALAFTSEGLDPMRYGMICRDEVDGSEVWGVRYDELLAFIISAL